MNAYLQALAQWPLPSRHALTGVLTDIDDTLTTHGAITGDALAALHALAGAGDRGRKRRRRLGEPPFFE